MDIKSGLTYLILIVCLFSWDCSASNSIVNEGGNGFKVELSAKDSKYVFWETVTVFCDIQNTSDIDSILRLEPGSVEAIVEDLAANRKYAINCNMPKGDIVIPKKSNVCFILKLEHIPIIGKYYLQITYDSPKTGYLQELDTDISVFSGTLVSNELLVNATTDDPKAGLEEENVEQFVLHMLNKMKNVGSGLIAASSTFEQLGNVALPYLLKMLNYEDKDTRIYAIKAMDIIGRSEGLSMPEGWSGKPFIEEYISAYKNEGDYNIKRHYFNVMLHANDKSEKSKGLVLQTLINALDNNQREGKKGQAFRFNAAITLLYYDKYVGLREILGKPDRFDSLDSFGRYKLNLLFTLSEVAGVESEYGGGPQSFEQLKAWWEGNKSVLKNEGREGPRPNF